jgi:hypothetical protein
MADWEDWSSTEDVEHPTNTIQSGMQYRNLLELAIIVGIVVSGFSIDEGGVLLRRLHNSGIREHDMDRQLKLEY